MDEEKAIRTALSVGGADYLEIRFENYRSTSIVYSGRELEELAERYGVHGSVRACVRGGWGFASFNDLSRLEAHARRAVDYAKAVGKEETKLASVEPRRADVNLSSGVDPASVGIEEKHDLIRRYNQGLFNHEKVQGTNARYRDGAIRKVMATSDGAFIRQTETFCGVSLVSIARDGNVIQAAHESRGDLTGFEKCRGLEPVVERCVKSAVDQLSAPRVKAGKYTVILDPLMAGVFVHEAFGHLSEADFIYENPRFQEIMKPGRRFGEEHLFIVDDATIPGMAGTIAYDDEGVPGARKMLIEKGILKERLHSRETAGRMNEGVTGSARAISARDFPIVRMTNTFIEPGEKSLEELFSGVEDGLYIQGSLGGMTNAEMFTFSAREAFAIRNGSANGRVRDVVLSGNVFETLANIDAIGNDFHLFGGLGGCGKSGQSPLRVGLGGPHIRIQGVIVGGS